MKEKTKQRLTVAALIVLAIIAIYLLLKNNPGAAGGTTNTLGGNTNGGVGGNSYNLGGVTIPALAGPGAIPNVQLGMPGDGQSCCASCGCDSDNGVNGFAASVQQALNGYSQSIGNLMQQTSSSLFGNIPDFVAQYIATADPQAPNGLSG